MNDSIINIDLLLPEFPITIPTSKYLLAISSIAFSMESRALVD